MLAGDLWLGSVNNYYMLIKMFNTSYTGDQLFIRISRHMLPSTYTLGWNTLVKNFTFGALFGY